MRYFLDISYVGVRYHGWQIQPNGNTIQADIEKGLSLLLRENITIVGSGRTDAGVHAAQQVAHFDTNRPIMPKDLAYKLNSLLTKDISINRIVEVGSKAHARFSVVERTYQYRIHQRKDPFKQSFSYYFSPRINVSSIQEACKIIKEWQNFRCFSKVHTEVSHFNCCIFHINWSQNGNSHLFIITANRFLRGMVRAIIGTLLDVGTCKTSLSKLSTILESGDRSKAGRTAPSYGLFLHQVTYPQHIFK